MNYKRKFCLVLALLLVSSILFMSVDTTVYAAGEAVELKEVSFTCDNEDYKNFMSDHYDLIPWKKIPRPSGPYNRIFIAENHADILSVDIVYIQHRTNGGEWTTIYDYPVEAMPNYEYRYNLKILCKSKNYCVTGNTKLKINGEYITPTKAYSIKRVDGTSFDIFFNEKKVLKVASRPNAKDGLARTGVVNEGKSLVYNGREQTAYESGNGYTVENNKATDAGIYTAVFKVNNDYIWRCMLTIDGIQLEDYTKNDIKIKWEITKAQGNDPAYVAPTGLSGKKGKKLSTVALPEGFVWKNPDQELNEIGEKEFKAIYKSKNYVDKEVDLKLNVEEAPEPTPNPPAPPTPNPPVPPAPSPDSYYNYENDTKYHRIDERKSTRHKRIVDTEEEASLDKEDEKTINKDAKIEDRSIVLAVGSKLMSVFGKNVTNDTAPIIKNNRTMLPARFVAESLGAQVTWNDTERTVYIKGLNLKTMMPLEIKLTIGSNKALVNGTVYELDSPVFIENDRTYTPLRFIAEMLGAEVYWDEATKVVRIIK